MSSLRSADQRHNLEQLEIRQLERVQKTACAIILGQEYDSNKSALQILEMETLEFRREKISLTFAKKALKSEKFKQWFEIEENYEQNMKTRNFKPKPKLKPVQFRTTRYKKSPLSYLTQLLNSQK